MLTSIIVHLFPVKKATLPPTMGHYIHAALLDILRRVDTEIAEQLHLDQPYKPFTVSPLQGRFDKPAKGRLAVRAGAECWIRFTILDDALLAAIVRFFLEDKSSMLRLCNNIFQITKVTTNGNGTNGDWSACTTFEEIFDCASPFDRLNIRFYSPTTFRVRDRTMSGSQNYIFPDPLHCFQSWLRNWNARSPIHVDEDILLDFVHRHIRSSRYSIRTRMMNFSGYKQLGFVGNCEYQFAENISTSRLDRTNESLSGMLKQINALANFAFYCGTGYKTTMGMGQTRREEFT